MASEASAGSSIEFDDSLKKCYELEPVTSTLHKCQPDTTDRQEADTSYSNPDYINSSSTQSKEKEASWRREREKIKQDRDDAATRTHDTAATSNH